MTDMSDLSSFDIATPQGFSVLLPSGAEFVVLTNDELGYVNDRVRRYLTDNIWKNVSDLQDVDRMVMFELLVHRWSLWISKGVDYFNDEINERQLAERVQAYSSEIRQLKKTLGVDKVARDRARGDDSVSAYLQQLAVRAKEFGVMRNDQFNKVLELFHELKSLLTYHDNCDEMERVEGHITQDELVAWIRDTAIPEFDSIDEKFRTEKQTMWVRQQ